jgi:DNA-binding GntR family transcriptional regulator
VIVIDPLGPTSAIAIQDRTLTDQVVRLIRKQIMLGHLQAGQRLGEMQLTEQLNVSRGTIREALRRLEAEYLVETISHRGSRVACLTPADAVEICDLHAMLESWSVQHLSIPIAEPLRQQLETLVAQMRALVFPAGVDRFIELDHAFHRGIVEAASQRWVMQVWSDISSLLGVLVTLSVRYLHVDAETVANRHQAIIDALSQPDSSRDTATQAVGNHYESLARTLVQSERETDNPGIGET